MKVVALRRRSSGRGVKPPTAALAEDRCRERVGKGAHDASGGDREGERKRIAIEVSKLVLDGIKTGARTRFQDESGGYPVTGQVDQQQAEMLREAIGRRM